MEDMKKGLHFFFEEEEIANMKRSLVEFPPFFLHSKTSCFSSAASCGAKYYPYGTAGFRSNANELHHVIHLCGMYTAVLSKVLTYFLLSSFSFQMKQEEEEGKKEEREAKMKNAAVVVGAMITASHNPAEDNGIKIILSNGEMLHKNLEKSIASFVNVALKCKNGDEWITNVINFLDDFIANDLLNFAQNDFLVDWKENENMERSFEKEEEEVIKYKTDMTNNKGQTHSNNDNAEKKNNIKNMSSHQNEKTINAQNITPKIIAGYDTRKSSVELTECFIAGAKSAGGKIFNVGEVTTPQTHFLTKHFNFLQRNNIDVHTDFYFDYFTEHFDKLIKALNERERNEDTPEDREEKKTSINCTTNETKKIKNSENGEEKEKNVLFVDCANGVGAKQFVKFIQKLKELGIKQVEILNDGKNENQILNYHCGAEFVQKENKLPKPFCDNKMIVDGCVRCCSFDGDADRIVYYLVRNESRDNRCNNNNNNNEEKGGIFDKSTFDMRVLDGDKIAALFVDVLVFLISNIFLENQKHLNQSNSEKMILRVGIIQTAYANGSSSEYIRQMIKKIQETDMRKIAKFDLCLVKTGVKYLHEKAKEYDVSVYFESNGHGTLIHNHTYVQSWARTNQLTLSRSFSFLKNFIELFNETTGDAMADLLAVEFSLKYLKRSFMDWLYMYEELPCLSTKVHLSRSILDRLKPNDEDETYLLHPKSLQERISGAVQKYGLLSRAFVRPSGTEDVCRIYAETKCPEKTKQLSEELHKILVDFSLTV